MAHDNKAANVTRHAPVTTQQSHFPARCSAQGGTISGRHSEIHHRPCTLGLLAHTSQQTDAERDGEKKTAESKGVI